jgi:5-methylcytosine-specific restriction endonuclease McrA
MSKNKRGIRGYEVLGIFEIDEVLPFVEPEGSKKKRTYTADDGTEYQVRMDSQRYHNFKEHGCSCVRCGLEGKYFKLERNGSFNPHFNLYGKNKQGKEVMLTKDHVVPKSWGGKNHLDNYQPMCSKCNSHKGSAPPGDVIVVFETWDQFSENCEHAPEGWYPPPCQRDDGPDFCDRGKCPRLKPKVDRRRLAEISKSARVIS